MSVYSVLAGLLHPIPPENWTLTDPDGTQGTVTKADARIVAANSPLKIEFGFTVSGTPHVLAADVAVGGSANISLDGVAEPDHPGIVAGTALHWEPLPAVYVIVKFRFTENGKAVEYRFEGKR